MSNLNYQELTLDSDTFETVRANFDLLLQKLLNKMSQNDSDEGSITLKIDIQMMSEFIPDEDGGSHKANKPVFKHKVTTTVPVKDSLDDKKDTGMELVYDDELKRYILKYVSPGGQRSIFDEDFEENINGDGTIIDSNEVPQLPGETNLLEGPVEDADEDTMEVPDYDEEIDGNSMMNAPDEEITDEDETEVAEGRTEATDGVDDEYEYDEPEEE